MRRFSNAHVSTAIILLSILACVAAVTVYVRHRAQVEEVGSAAAESLRDSDEQPYTDLEGKPFSFSNYRNRIRIVNVWASWSPYTATEFPILNEIASAYQSDQLVVIAINRKEPLERIAAYVRHLNTDTSHIVPVVDLTDAFYTSVAGFAMPETIVYNQSGDIVYRARGVFDEAELRAVIHDLLVE